MFQQVLECYVALSVVSEIIEQKACLGGCAVFIQVHSFHQCSVDSDRLSE